MKKGGHNKPMKKIHFALCSILLLASCGGSNSDEGKNYISSFRNAYEASYSSGSYLFSCPNGMSFALGIRNQNDAYYHLTGSGLTFEAGFKGVKGNSASDLKAELLLTGGDIKLDTDSKKIPSSLSGFLKISDVKAKSYFDGDALYFNASGENKGKETNSTIGLLAQTAIREIAGDSSYNLYGGGNVLEGKNRYKGKWTLKDEDKQKITDKMPLVKDGDTLSQYFSLSSFLEGAYEDSQGKTAFSFSTKDDGTKRIGFSTKDKSVLSAALTAGFASFSDTLSASESLPSEEEVKERIDKFFTYASIKTFSLTALFTDSGLDQVIYDVNFALDKDKIEETYPDGMFDLSENAGEGEDKKDYIFNLDESLSFTGSVLTEFGDEDSFSLPDLSEYLEFPEIARKDGNEE